MELFDNYLSGTSPINNKYYCDITEETDYPDPVARVYCFGFGVGYGTYGCPDLVIQNNLISCNEQQSWNCNLCGNDLPFWIPFKDGDTFDFQFQQLFTSVLCDHPFYPENLIDGGNTAAVSFQIKLCCDDTVFELTEEMVASIIQESYVGGFLDNSIGSSYIVPIQMMRINLQAIKEYMILADIEPCFYFVFDFPTIEGVCFPNAFADKTTFYSEPFKYDKCESFPYVYRVESTYSLKDCYNNYYGSNFIGLDVDGTYLSIGNAFVYSNAISVPGSFEHDGFVINKEVINSSLKATSSQVCENWSLKTSHLPSGFARFLVSVLGGKDVLVDGVEYQVQGEITRNNETGNQFYLDVKMQNCNCNKSLSCQ
jgi:hypothetical protein